MKQAVEKQLETESQLSSLRKEFETVRQENELLNKEIKIHRELIIDLDEAKVSFNEFKSERNILVEIFVGMIGISRVYHIIIFRFLVLRTRNVTIRGIIARL